MVQSNRATINLYWDSTCHLCFPHLTLTACAAWSTCAVFVKQTGETDSLKSCFCSYLLVFPTSNTPCHDRPRGQADTCAWQLRAGKGGWAEPWSSSVSQHCPRAAHERLALTHPRLSLGSRVPLLQPQEQGLCWPRASLPSLFKDQALSAMPKRAWALSHSCHCWLQHPQLQVWTREPVFSAWPSW